MEIKYGNQSWATFLKHSMIWIFVSKTISVSQLQPAEVSCSSFAARHRGWVTAPYQQQSCRSASSLPQCFQSYFCLCFSSAICLFLPDSICLSCWQVTGRWLGLVKCIEQATLVVQFLDFERYFSTWSMGTEIFQISMHICETWHIKSCLMIHNCQEVVIVRYRWLYIVKMCAVFIGK